MTTTTTTTFHLEISEVEQATPTTRMTPTVGAPAASYAAENDLARDLEDLAVRRLRNPGELVDAVTVFPELAD